MASAEAKAKLLAAAKGDIKVTTAGSQGTWAGPLKRIQPYKLETCGKLKLMRKYAAWPTPIPLGMYQVWHRGKPRTDLLVIQVFKDSSVAKTDAKNPFAMAGWQLVRAKVVYKAEEPENPKSGKFTMEVQGVDYETPLFVNNSGELDDLVIATNVEDINKEVARFLGEAYIPLKVEKASSVVVSLDAQTETDEEPDSDEPEADEETETDDNE